MTPLDTQQVKARRCAVSAETQLKVLTTLACRVWGDAHKETADRGGSPDWEPRLTKQEAFLEAMATPQGLVGESIFPATPVDCHQLRLKETWEGGKRISLPEGEAPS